MSAKQDRQGVRRATDLEQKYNLDDIAKMAKVVRVDSAGKKSVAPDNLDPSGLGNCEWEYIESIGRTVLVKIEE